MSPTLRRLHPDPPGDVTVEAFYAAERRRHSSRPWVMVTMIASIDGATTVDGRSGDLGNRSDAAALAATRAAADVLLVGAGTIRAEGYGPPRIPGLRIGVVSRSGAVDPASALFTSGAGFLVLTESAPSHGLPTIRAGDDDVDLLAVLQRLDAIVPGAGVVGCEGGPRLNASLAEAGCIDELNLTISPRIAGGEGPRLVTGARAMRLDLAPRAIAIDADGYVFSRWTR